ncbi:UDP-galactose transporter senju [Athalia rosae]|uniref:UDP-galactose transporter senju n=1 Tax=Athalia rosae TaxID=37344 RepID=UPI0020343F9C|nr:UDP-galactose transporter senju [Athalia rosae]XP_012266860.2 UDP-galactose transporter senju [Athalia rosae]XP_020711694.2 UDP-galactose transporter senju [Athalia rosae]XP_020711695.2 UDP-galactose transporter senju [Athalia rosae]
MGHVNWQELFPSRWSVVIFIAYMTLFINQGILVTWSQSKKNSYEYDTVTVVTLTEVLKLVLSVAFYCRNHSILSLIQEIRKYKRVLLLYMVPASLYCLYNNLAFVNLAAFDPTTYYLLLQFRVVVTGIVFQVVFKKQLSTKQWISLVLLTFGCMVKHLDMNYGIHIFQNWHFSLNALFIFVQTLCSCLAGVYNEYLLKGHGAKIDIFVQNVFMYIDSIFCNVAVLIGQGSLAEIFSQTNQSIFTQPKVLLIMVNNAAGGIITSFFLQSLNSILKTFASALELVFTAILCWILFNIPVYLNTVLAIVIVSYSVLLYSQNPVQNAHPKSCPDNQSDVEPLVSPKEVELV